MLFTFELFFFAVNSIGFRFFSSLTSFVILLRSCSKERRLKMHAEHYKKLSLIVFFFCFIYKSTCRKNSIGSVGMSETVSFDRYKKLRKIAENFQMRMFAILCICCRTNYLLLSCYRKSDGL